MFEELKLLPCPNDCKHGLVDVFEYPSGNPEESCDIYQVACACACGVRGPLKYTRKEVADARNSLPRRLRWTKEKPTEPDFYWNRDGRLLRVGEILEISGALWCHFAGESEPQLLELVGGEWAGPIQEPEESHDAAE